MDEVFGRNNADRQDAMDGASAAEDQALPPLPEQAISQRAVVSALAEASDKGLTASEIAEPTQRTKTPVTQFNVYEKLARLEELGYVEEVPDSNPKRWRLTPRGRGQAA
jgi:DNA-binding transcriptional ArsR family regulator